MVGLKRIMIPFCIILLAVIIVSGGYLFLTTYRNNYLDQNLLRIDPLDTGSLRSGKPDLPPSDADIWMIGDSRIARWNLKYFNDGPGIVNLGGEGHTSAQVYYRLKNYLDAYAPSIVVLEAGINDLKVIGADRDMAPYITENLYRNIDSIRHLCVRKNISLIIINVFPVGKIEPARRLVWNKYANEAIIMTNRKLLSYCDEKTVFCLDAYSLLSSDDKTVNPEYRYDFLHINEKGYEILSKALSEKINDIKYKKQ